MSDAFEEFSSSDWLEAFAAHPRIGDRAASGREAAEQAGALGAPAAVLAELASLNAEYEKRFGHIFIACAAGQPAASLVAGLKARLGNAPDAELAIAAEEQKKITRLRLAKLLAGDGRMRGRRDLRSRRTSWTSRRGDRERGFGFFLE